MTLHSGQHRGKIPRIVTNNVDNGHHILVVIDYVNTNISQFSNKKNLILPLHFFFIQKITASVKSPTTGTPCLRSQRPRQDRICVVSETCEYCVHVLYSLVNEPTVIGKICLSDV